MKRKHILAAAVVLGLLCLPSEAQVRKAEYLGYIRRAAELGWQDYPQAIETWKKTTQPSELWGYDGPGQPVYLADLLAFLFADTGDRSFAEQAIRILADYGDLRQFYPEEQRKQRAEYRSGIPAISNFFILPPYARAYMRLSSRGLIESQVREKIERDLAFSLDHIFHFPEWGAHNRAMLRAESLYYGALALPAHPHAARWKQMAERLASDSLHQWEIEDAAGYHAVWLYSLFSYADISRRPDVLRSVQVRFYLDYFLQLLTPHGNVADFGDSHWNGGWDRLVPVYEKAAALFGNPQYKWMAEQLVRRNVQRLVQQSSDPGRHVPTPYIGTGFGSEWTDAYRWADDAVPSAPPTSGSQEALEDLVGKKIVFRNGWDPTSSMLVLNYRDEGDGGRLGRDYLRQTISVEEEKMHHGHADENSIVVWMSGGSVLLHDGGYRPDLPSGPYGGYRADYFHNRVVARLNRRDKQQNLFEFLRNSGAYRRVTTQKIDFLRLQDVDTSRTRLIDSDQGYQWDRTLVHLKEKDLFIVIDGIQALRSDYFTFTNLWHTRQVLQSRPEQAAAWFDTCYDRIRTDVLPDQKALLVYFPENGGGKQIGTFPVSRHFQDETAIYQTVSRFYRAGDMETFVTILLPHDRKDNATGRLRDFNLVAVDRPGKAVALSLQDGAEQHQICVKLDLDMDLAAENVRPLYRQALGRVKYGDLETDAGFLFARIGTQQIRYSASGMTWIGFRGKPLLEALPMTFGLQLDGAPPRTGLARWRCWEETVPLP
jgi:hypothetical protein